MSDDATTVLQTLADQVARLQEQLMQHGQHEATHQQAFERLYSEMQQYKNDFIFQTEKPLLLDLVLYYDSLNWFKESLLRDEMSPDVVADSFQYLLDEFLELLYRRDVLPMPERTSYDRTTQKAIKVVQSPDPAQNNRVQQVLKRGFTRAGKVLRAEEVVLRRHLPPDEDTE